MFAKLCDFIYIGLTQQNPQTRFSQHQGWWHDADAWDQMVVLLKASSFAQMNLAEDELIAYARSLEGRPGIRAECFNDRDHAPPGRSADQAGYFVYMMYQYRDNKGLRSPLTILR